MSSFKKKLQIFFVAPLNCIIWYKDMNPEVFNDSNSFLTHQQLSIKEDMLRKLLIFILFYIISSYLSMILKSELKRAGTKNIFDVVFLYA